MRAMSLCNTQTVASPATDTKNGETEERNLPDSVTGQRAASLSGWMKSILIKERPERGGTIRERGYWEKFDMDRPQDAWRPRRRVTDSFAKSRRSDTEDSDRLVRWNMAKDIPEEQTQLRIMKPPKRTVSANVSFAPPQAHRRRFSWGPHSQEDSQFSAIPAGASRAEAQPNSDAEEVVSDSPSIAADRRLLRVRQNIEARKEVHRKRRDLKENGDYLGPQGINPETGQLDIDTPSTSDGNSENQREEDEMHQLRKALKQARDNASKPARSKERELKRIFVSKEKEKMKKKQQEKNTLSKMHNGLKWKRHTKRWSSAQEPELSPIAQSHQSGTSSSKKYCSVLLVR